MTTKIQATKSEPVPALLQDGEVDKYIARHVCALCYGDLIKRPVSNPRGWEVSCPVCGDAWKFNTVTRRYAERLGQQALADYRDARRRFTDIVPSSVAGKSSAQILKELGY